MIVVKFKGQNPGEIRQQVMDTFGLVEPTLLPGDEIQTADGGEAVVVQTAVPEEPKKQRQTRKKTEVAPAAEVDDVGERPAFLDAKPKAEASAPEANAEDAAKLLEQLRGVAGQCTEAGVSMVDITKLIQTFKTPDGAKALKMSQIRAEDLPKAVAACTALLPAKKA